MKTVSILIPTYNEKDNIAAMVEACRSQIKDHLPGYGYEIVMIDNASTDGTREIEEKLCREDPCVKAIFNAKNFGPFNSPYYGLLQTTGDCTVKIAADFQEPPELIPEMVHYWEQGYKLVVTQKTTSEESRFMYAVRSFYYKLLRKMSDIEMINQYTGFGLYDQSFIEFMRSLNDPTPFLRGIVAEFGYKMKTIQYSQKKRRTGKSHHNFMSLYDGAMLSMTSYTKIGLRIATFLGVIVAFASVVIGIIYLVLKLIYWDRFLAGQAPTMIGMFFLGAVILIFLGLMGEYVISINKRLMNRPLVLEEERLNFSEEDYRKGQVGVPKTVERIEPEMIQAAEGQGDRKE